MIHLHDARLFVRVAATGSFSAAARQLDLTPAAVSATIKKLEAQLHVRLFERSTRALRLTAEGEQFQATCERLLATWTEGEAEWNGAQHGLAGVVHLAAPNDLSQVWLAGWLPQFLAQHPHLQVVLHASDVVQALPREGIDLALRYGALADSSLVARRLADNPRVLVASHAYLAAHGAPQEPQDIARHPCLTLFLQGRRHVQWAFERGGRTLSVRVDGGLSSSSGALVRQWALEGRGLAYKSRLDVLPDLQAGRLVALLPGWTTEATPLHAVHAQRPAPLRVRRLLDFLAARFAALAPALSGTSAPAP